MDRALLITKSAYLLPSWRFWPNWVKSADTGKVPKEPTARAPNPAVGSGKPSKDVLKHEDVSWEQSKADQHRPEQTGTERGGPDPTMEQSGAV